jgi:hypothetical protein
MGKLCQVPACKRTAWPKLNFFNTVAPGNWWDCGVVLYDGERAHYSSGYLIATKVLTMPEYCLPYSYMPT